MFSGVSGEEPSNGILNGMDLKENIHEKTI